MFNIGFTEMFALAVFALLVIGPKQLPEMARNIARLLNEFKRATGQITDPLQSMKDDLRATEFNAKEFVQKLSEDVDQSLDASVAQSSQAVAKKQTSSDEGTDGK